MTVLAVIPARGGSKRLPGKNLAQIGSKALVNRAIDHARDSGIVDKIIVTTDDEEIANTANLYLPGCVHMRDPSLARDDTPMLPVVLDVAEHWPHDVIILLQPTSPFRTGRDVREAYCLLQQNRSDSVVSVIETDEDSVFEVGWAGRLRPAPCTMRPNGAIYIITKEALDSGLDWYDGIVNAYIMNKDQSIDIDTVQDLEIARMLAAKNEPNYGNSGSCKVGAA